MYQECLAGQSADLYNSIIHFSPKRKYPGKSHRVAKTAMQQIYDFRGICGISLTNHLEQLDSYHIRALLSLIILMLLCLIH